LILKATMPTVELAITNVKMDIFAKMDLVNVHRVYQTVLVPASICKPISCIVANVKWLAMQGKFVKLANANSTVPKSKKTALVFVSTPKSTIKIVVPVEIHAKKEKSVPLVNVRCLARPI